MAFIGEAYRKFADNFHEHVLDIHEGAAKLAFLQLNRPSHQDEEDIFVNTLKSCSMNQITHKI